MTESIETQLVRERERVIRIFESALVNAIEIESENYQDDDSPMPISAVWGALRLATAEARGQELGAELGIVGRNHQVRLYFTTRTVDLYERPPLVNEPWLLPRRQPIGKAEEYRWACGRCGRHGDYRASKEDALAAAVEHVKSSHGEVAL